MPTILASEQKKTKVPAFDRLYTEDQRGVYIRNAKPSSGVIDQKRIADNMRTLVDTPHTENDSE